MSADFRMYHSPERTIGGLEAENARLRGLIWYAWWELNQINARSGAPSGVAQSWWDELTAELESTLGDQCRPWPPEDAKPFSALQRNTSEEKTDANV